MTREVLEIRVKEAFPVLWQGHRVYLLELKAAGCPRKVPWDFVASMADGCRRNHSQTVERLAERGGLAPQEIVALTKEFSCSWKKRIEAWAIPTAEAVRMMLAMVEEWQAKRAPGAGVIR